MMKMSLGATLGAAVLGTSKGSAATDAPPKEPVKAADKNLEYGTLGGRKMSRLILGSNVPGAHSRDLAYAGALGTAYNTTSRLLDTFALAESQGINTILQQQTEALTEYNAKRGGKLKVINYVWIGKDDDKNSIKGILTGAMKANNFTAALYLHGLRADELARDKRMESSWYSHGSCQGTGDYSGHRRSLSASSDSMHGNGYQTGFLRKNFPSRRLLVSDPERKPRRFLLAERQYGGSQPIPRQYLVP